MPYRTAFGLFLSLVAYWSSLTKAFVESVHPGSATTELASSSSVWIAEVSSSSS